METHWWRVLYSRYLKAFSPAKGGARPAAMLVAPGCGTGAPAAREACTVLAVAGSTPYTRTPGRVSCAGGRGSGRGLGAVLP